MGSLADTSMLELVFATAHCKLAKSETRVNKLQECGVNLNYPVVSFRGEGSLCSGCITTRNVLELSREFCSSYLKDPSCIQLPVFHAHLEIQNAVASTLSVCPSVI